MTLAVALATVGMTTSAFAAPPSNDDFSNAEVVNPDEVGCSVWRFGERSLAQATAQQDEPVHHGSPADQSIWFTVTPPATGTAQLLVERNNAPHALRVAAYEGA